MILNIAKEAKLLRLDVNYLETEMIFSSICSKHSMNTLLTYIGNTKNFSTPKKLVAFIGVNTSVSQSISFTSTHNKFTKRGSNFTRKILFNLALASIKSFQNGVTANTVLLVYYKKLTTSKSKKVAISAIIRKTKS